jgi:hypothetical protein
MQPHENVDVWTPEQERRCDLLGARGPAVLFERGLNLAEPGDVLAMMLFFHLAEAEA